MTDGSVPSGAGPSAVCAGLILAAGSGSRMGTAKGLLRRPDGTPFVTHAVRVVASGGAARVIVVVGAMRDDVSSLVPGDVGVPVEVVHAADWEEGMSASLRAGLRALSGAPSTATPASSPTPALHPTAAPRPTPTLSPTPAPRLTPAFPSAPADVQAVVVSLVDTPGVTAAAVGRLVALAGAGVLARCAYDGVPGHPVLIGREHWAGVLSTAVGDAGARNYLRSHDVTLVEASDVAEGTDVDTREQYVRWSRDRP